jgi:hypothetical protein
MDANQAGELARRVVEAINDRDYRQIDQLTTEHIQLRFPPGQVLYGRDGVREFFAALESGTPDLVLTARKVQAGDDFAVVEYDATSPRARTWPRSCSRWTAAVSSGASSTSTPPSGSASTGRPVK